MKRFRSVALDSDGKKYAGSFHAESHEEALRMLHAQGFQVLTLEEIPDEEVEVESPSKMLAQASLKKPEPKAGQSQPAKAGFAAFQAGGTSIWKTLGIGAAVLGGIPLLIFVLMPRPPLNKPEDVTRSYFQLEMAGDYSAQYGLFSNGRAVLAGTRESYTAKRQAESKRKLDKQAAAVAETGEEPDADAADKPKPLETVPALAGVEKRSETEREAETAAFIVRGSVQEEYVLKLGLEKRTWKIKDIKFSKRKELGKPKPEKEDNDDGAKTEDTPSVKAEDKAPVKTEAEKPESKMTPSKSGLKPVPGEELQPEKPSPQAAKTPGSPPAKANVNAAKQQALDLIDEARERGVIDEKEYQYRKKQLGL